MNNLTLAWTLREIANLLELQGGNRFKIRAYQRAARAIETLPEDIKKVYEAGNLQKIDGIGKAIADKIEEWFQTGRIAYLERLRKEVPEGLLELTAIPGIGPKMAKRLHEELGISSVDELETACQAQNIRKLRGFGARTEWSILRGIHSYRNRGGETPLAVALAVAAEIRADLSRLHQVEKVAVVGSVRRRKDMVRDIDLLAVSDSPEPVMQVFTAMPSVGEVLACGNTKSSVRLKVGIPVDLRVVSPPDFWSALQYFTGSAAHNVQLRKRAARQDLKITEYGVFRGETRLPINSEEELYNLLGLQYIVPELREDQGELQAAAAGTLPRLIELSDIKGDLHAHSTWSDGVMELEEMAAAARARGYQYMAVCDHSQSLRVANGLDVERLRRQAHQIADLNQEFDDFRLLSGIEVDILADGSLDLPDDVLAERDVVVASIHTGFRQEGERLTQRVLQAMQNEHVDIIGHPTGRLLGRRDPYEIDMEQVIEMAAKTGTALEINSSPDRLDMNDIYARWAREAGVKVVINTDAHSLEEMDNMQLGVNVGRRAWLEKKDVLNTWTGEELLAYLRRD